MDATSIKPSQYNRTRFRLRTPAFPSHKPSITEDEIL